MEKISWNEGWRVWPVGDEAAAVPVTLPHDAMLTDKRDASSAGGRNIGWFIGRDYVYEKTFHAPLSWADQHIQVEFEGVYRRAKVLLNGEAIGGALNGYLPFRVALDGLLRLGEENTISVEARNADQPNSRWYSGTGIYRPVSLLVLPQVHLLPDGVKISTMDWRSRTIRVDAQASAHGTAQVEILDGSRVIALHHLQLTPCGEMELSLPEAQLWSPENPKRYTCRISLGQDVREVLFGIRSICCSAWDGFCINGQRIILRGACIHHDNGLLGAVADPCAERRKVQLLMNAGYNAIRSAHNACSEALLEACDHVGMLVVDEYADMWYIHKTQHDDASYVPECWQADLKTLSDRDYNHPSVVMYSIGNEVSETAQPQGIQLAEKMCSYLHDIDNRPVTCGINIFFNFLSAMGFGVYSDRKARREAARAEKRKSGTGRKAVGSEFFNNMAGLLGSDVMKCGALLHGSDIKSRDAFAVLDVAGYNYGIRRYRKDLKKYPNRVILGSETFCSDAYEFWELAKAHPALIGDFVWTGMDHLGEVGLGAWEYAEYAPDFGHGPGWITSGSGRLDITGRMWGEACYTQVALECSQGPAIAVCPVNHTGEKHSPSAWRMSNALPSWSWEGCEGRRADVEVYARAAAVELRINGRRTGRKKLKNSCVARFRVPYESGAIEAIAWDAQGRETGRCTLRTAGQQTVLRALPEQPCVQPGSLSYIRLRYCDEAGEIKPLERGTLRVAVKGATLVGLGSACPYYERSYLSDEADTYYGEALAIVRAADGPFTLCVSDGTLTDSVTVEVPH